MDSIICPHCKKKVALSEAIVHELSEKVREEEKEEKIRHQAERQALEKSRLEKKEFEKKISDMQKALEDAQRKAKQGSQQLQGEVLELDLEENLKEAFPHD